LRARRCADAGEEADIEGETATKAADESVRTTDG
jgi:hypothetical protein